MDSLRRRLVIFVTLVALALFGSLLVAQQTPNDCEKACLAQYIATVKACHGDATCRAVAREALKSCIGGCTHPRD
jgi:hypothetical protein